MEVVAAVVVIMAMEQREISRCLRQISISKPPTLGLTRRQWHQRRRMSMMRMPFPLTPTRQRTRRMMELITQRNLSLILYRLQRRLLRHQHVVLVDGEVVVAETVGRRRGNVTLLHLVSLGVWG